LHLHLDRPACEISATVTLDFEGDIWPIFVGKKSAEKTPMEYVNDKNETLYWEELSKIDMNIGDAVVYRGTEMFHWREKYTEGKWQAQVFLHYVDADGPYTEWIYDKQKSLTLIDTGKDDLTYWRYDDVLAEQDCDFIVSMFSSSEGEVASIGGETGEAHVQKEIRNVSRVELPTYKGIGATLTAVGINANQQRWKFNIYGSNQCEFLNYPAGGGRYRGHIDTFLSNVPKHQNECRKLTVLAFLNDDFKGGKFWLQTGSERFYPKQTKGTVLVFPSFLLHGVEDVEEGERYTVVTWLVGPWFN